MKCRSWTAAPAPFVFLIQSAGIEVQNSPKRFVRVRRPIEVKEGDKWARFEPHEGFRVNFEIEFDHPVFHRHSQRAIDGLLDHDLPARK